MILYNNWFLFISPRNTIIAKAEGPGKYQIPWTDKSLYQF